jgi:hypothetical protein
MRLVESVISVILLIAVSCRRGNVYRLAEYFPFPSSTEFVVASNAQMVLDLSYADFQVRHRFALFGNQ